MAPALLVGLVNGIGVGVFRVHPLIMTLGTGLIAFGGLQVYQRTVIATGFDVPAVARMARHRHHLRASRIRCSSSSRSPR